MLKIFFLLSAFFSLNNFSGIVSLFDEKPTSSTKINLRTNKICSSKKKLINPVDLNNYTFVMKDDFDGKALDKKKWQYYEENTIRGFAKVLKSNVAVSGGTLKLYAKRETDSLNNPLFSSAMISTGYSFQQKYGYFEIRAKMLTQEGPHCAFWLLQHSVGVVNKMPNPSLYGTEIDIFEYHRGAGTENLYFGLHWNGYNFSDGSHRSTYGKAELPGISTGFHIFGFEWTPKEYIVYVDGIEKARSNTAISHIPEFIILSTEIVGYGGDRFKMNTKAPDIFEVDYLKVYARKPSVTLYGDCDYYGWVSSALTPGSYTTSELIKLGVVDNETSSIEIPPGWIVTVYDGDNFTGNSKVITKDLRCITGFDNKISSMKITNH